MTFIADTFEDLAVESAVGNALGVITRGSLERGIEMKLHPNVSVESIKAGTFVIIKGESHDFFSMITDVTLDASNPDILLHPPEASEKLLLRVLQQTAIYTTVKLKPMLMLPLRADKPVGEAQIKSRDGEAQMLANDNHASHRVLDFPLNGGANGSANGNVNSKNHAPKTDDHLPVKTVPTHFSRVVRASDEDVERIFGREDPKNSDWFNVGNPLDMTTAVCIDLPRFVQRSNGVFGKSGTGKTFLTRTVLCGLIHHQPKVVNLIFDVHNEYGGTTTSESGSIVGLRDLFGARRVKIYTLDAQSSRTRNLRADEEVKISLDKIEPDDILSMQDELNLADAAAETAYQARNVLGTSWLRQLLEINADGESTDAESSTRSDETDDKTPPTTKSLAERIRAHEGSLGALQRKLKARLVRDGKLLPFLTAQPTGRDILKTLLHDIESGTNIVLEFGGQQSMLAYLLVANVLTRRIHAEYVHKHETWVGRGQHEHERPNHLMITIEEAHKFLNPKAARQTIFGTIAREMRKYWVTLLVVDQRPSGIDDEVLSQIGTRISAQLNDEADIAAVLTGMSGASGLKGILAQLDSKQQALVMGHSVPMPVMIETRTYNEKMWETFGYNAAKNLEPVRRDDF